MGPVFLSSFKSFQRLGLGVSIMARVFLLHLVRFYQAYFTLVMRYCHVTGGGQISSQI